MLVGSACGLHGTSYNMPSEVEGYYVMCAREDTLELAMVQWHWIREHGFNILYVVNYFSIHPELDDMVGGYAAYNFDYAVSNAFRENMLHEIMHLECDCNFHQ